MANRATELANFFATTTTGAITSGDTTFPVTTTVGGPASPCYIVIDPESASNREVIYCNGTFTGTSFTTSTVANRDLDGNGNLAHNSGVTVWVTALKQHFDDLNDRIDALGDLSDYLPLAGGTMTGDLTLAGAPDADLKASTKKYVDDSVAALSGTYATLLVDFDDESGTTDTLALADAGLVKRYTNASAVTVTVPPNSSVAFDIGSTVEIYAAGAGGVTVAAGSGVTVRNAGAIAQYGTATLTKHATDEWVLTGAVA